MAEAFILIAFALLLLFAFWQWEVQKEDTPEVLAFKELPQAYQVVVLSGIRDGSLDTFLTLQDMGTDFSEVLDIAEQKDKWRFIDKDDERRLLDAASQLPEDVQRDLADLVEAKDAIPVLKQLSELQELIRNGQTADVASLLAANAKLGEISSKIQAAAEQEENLVATLKSKLGDIVANAGGFIDDNGAIILPDQVLFEQGQAFVTPQLAHFLANACAPWLDTLKSSGIDIAEVKIEGHASSEWSFDSSPRQAYLGNLDLSQRRSQSVLRVCLDLVPDQDVLDWAREHLIAVGYSSARPVLRDGDEDKEASRRVVFSVTPDRDALINQIESETVRDATPHTPNYDRTHFGNWSDADGDCLDTRQEILLGNNVGKVIMAHDGCSLVRGLWNDPYTGKRFTDPSDLDIDHVVPISWAWDRGASSWNDRTRAEFYNDPAGLLAVSAAVNRSKGNQIVFDWLPPNQSFQCQYVLRFERLVRKYDLFLTEEEVANLSDLQGRICENAD